MAVKPNNIQYGVGDRVSLPLALGMGVQHCLVMSSTLVLAAILVDVAGGTSEMALQLVRLSMIAAGIGTILQSLKGGPVGSGYLCPNLVGPAFMPASVLAAKTGGLSTVFGMIVVTGLFQAVLSRFVHKLRVVLPPEVTGVIVAMVGVSLVPVGVTNLAGLGEGDTTTRIDELGLGLFTLFVMVAVTIWGKGSLHLFSVLIGVVTGYVLSFTLDIGADYGLLTSDLKIFEVPKPHLPTDLQLDLTLLVPFLIAGLASLIKGVGDLSTAQKINDETWVTPEMGSIRRGVLADALAVVSAGLIGGMAQSTSSSNVGVSLATGVTSRYIGFSAGALFIVCAFFPVFSLIFVAMADPVKGAVLIFAACFMIVSGLQLVMSRMLDARKIFVVGAAISAGLSVDMLPQLYVAAPAALQSFTTSSFAFSTVVAVVLNLIFRIGISRRATLELTPGIDSAKAVLRFLNDQGAAWGARADVVKRATDALTEFVDVAAPMDRVGNKIRINARYDQLHLDLFLLYGGEPIDLPLTPPRPDAIDDSADVLRQLSGYMIRTAASQVNATRRGDLNMLHLRFLH